MTKKGRSIPLETGLLEDLKDPEFAALYLKACLDDDSDEREEIFLTALARVAKAHGISDIARGADITRDSVYKALSKGGNPTIHTLWTILDQLELKLTVEPKRLRA